MEKLIISEQDIINSLCIYTARKKQVRPEDVEVELMFDDEYGFSAESWVSGRNQILITANIIEALRLWLDEVLQIDPFAASIELELSEEEGIIALIS